MNDVMADFLAAVAACAANTASIRSPLEIGTDVETFIVVWVVGISAAFSALMT